MAIGIGLILAIALIAIRLAFNAGVNEFENELDLISDSSKQSYNQFYNKLSTVYRGTGGDSWDEFVSLYNRLDAVEQVDTVYRLLYLKKEFTYNKYNTDYILCCREAALVRLNNEKILDEFSEFKNELNEDFSSVRNLLNNSTIDKALSWSSMGDCQKFFSNIEIATIRNDVARDIRKILSSMLLQSRNTKSTNDAARKEYDKQLRSALSNVSYSVRTNVKTSIGSARDFLYNKEQEHFVNTKTLGNYRYTTTRLQFKQDYFDSKLLIALNEAYENNSLSTGAKPYYKCFGSYNSCSDRSCSQIRVNAGNRDVVTLVKNWNDRVIRHAYIKAYSSYLFDIPNGTYKVIFYSGKGWNPEKVVINNECGPLRGGFVSIPSFTKDENLRIYGQIMTYTLSYQTNGNFTPAGSSAEEAF